MKRTLIAASIAMILSGCGDENISISISNTPESSEKIAENLGGNVDTQLVENACKTEVSACIVDEKGNVKISVESERVGSISFEPQYKVLVQEKLMNLSDYDRAINGDIKTIKFEDNKLIDNISYIVKYNKKEQPILVITIRLDQKEVNKLANTIETVELTYKAYTERSRTEFNGKSIIIDSSMEVFDSILDIFTLAKPKDESERPPVIGEPELPPSTKPEPPIDWTPINPDTINHAPTIESIKGQAIIVGETAQIAINASDKDNDSLTYSISGVNFATFDNNVLILEPKPTHVGSHTVTVTVRDGSLSATTEFTLEVLLKGVEILPPSISNTAPTIDPIDPVTFEWGKGTPIRVIAQDAEQDKLTYKLAKNNIATIDSKTGIISFKTDEDDIRSHILTVTVTDGRLSTSANLQVIVKKQTIDWTPINPDTINHAPTIESIKGQAIIVDETAQIVINASDKDNDSLTYSISGVNFATFDNNVLIFEPKATHVGSHTVIVTVSDGSLSATTEFALEVSLKGVEILPPSNTAPTIEPINPITFEWGKDTPIRVIAQDAEQGKLTYELAKNNIATIDSKTGTIHFKTDKDDVGTHKLTVTVTDGTLSSSANLQVTVKKQTIDWTPIEPPIDHTINIPEGWTLTQSALGFVIFYNETNNSLKYVPKKDLILKDHDGHI
ncbi:Ig-like domain-containing protein [Vibrio harveyi]